MRKKRNTVFVLCDPHLKTAVCTRLRTILSESNYAFRKIIFISVMNSLLLTFISLDVPSTGSGVCILRVVSRFRLREEKLESIGIFVKYFRIFKENVVLTSGDVRKVLVIIYK